MEGVIENLNKDAWSSNFVCLKSCYGYDEQSNFIEASNIQSEFCAITKEFLQSIKGWKHYKGAGGEEYALGYKINLAGKKNILIKLRIYISIVLECIFLLLKLHFKLLN